MLNSIERVVLGLLILGGGLTIFGIVTLSILSIFKIVPPIAIWLGFLPFGLGVSSAGLIGAWLCIKLGMELLFKEKEDENNNLKT